LGNWESIKKLRNKTLGSLTESKPFLIEDDEPFGEKTAGLTADLYQQMEDGEILDAKIRNNLKDLGHG